MRFSFVLLGFHVKFQEKLRKKYPNFAHASKLQHHSGGICNSALINLSFSLVRTTSISVYSIPLMDSLDIAGLWFNTQMHTQKWWSWIWKYVFGEPKHFTLVFRQFPNISDNNEKCKFIILRGHLLFGEKKYQWLKAKSFNWQEWCL